MVDKLLNELSNYGKSFLFDYRSPDGVARQVKFRLLEQEPYSLPGRDTVKLRLTPTGLDILFKPSGWIPISGSNSSASCRAGLWCQLRWEATILTGQW